MQDHRQPRFSMEFARGRRADPAAACLHLQEYRTGASNAYARPHSVSHVYQCYYSGSATAPSPPPPFDRSGRRPITFSSSSPCSSPPFSLLLRFGIPLRYNFRRLSVMFRCPTYVPTPPDASPLPTKRLIAAINLRLSCFMTIADATNG